MLGYFSLTLFVSATLLFLVQPMIGKLLLPQLGGTPAVWNTCMVFFQAVLLLGYGYTHVLTTSQPTRRQVIIQGVMLFFPFLVLPFALGNWAPPTDTNPVFSLIWKLTLLVGLPFFAVSTTAPLLQKWFVHTGHPAAKDPYFLYGASNLGSMLALLAYPTVVEPWLPVTAPQNTLSLQTQVHLWTLGYAVFVALVIGCAVVVWKALDRAPVIPAPLPAAAAVATSVPATAITATPRKRIGRLEAAAPTKPVVKPHIPAPPNDNITLWRRLRWIGLAAVPSSLMLGVTTSMITDIAAVAFFWILPLALYLATFILVFANWPMQLYNSCARALGWRSDWPTEWTNLPHTIVLLLQPCFLLFLVLRMIAHLSPPVWGEFLLQLAAFFSTALMCHGELARDRPSTKHLTEFYFWMSFGGVVGGLFNALVAPIVFQYGIWEYPITMVFACLLRSNLVTEDEKTLIPGDSTAQQQTRVGYALDLFIPAGIGLLAYLFVYAGTAHADSKLPLNHWLLLSLFIVGFIGWFGFDYYRFADHRRRIDVEYIKSSFIKSGFIIYIIIAVVATGGFYYRGQFYDLFLVKRSYLLALLVVIVLALSLRPIRFGLAVAALFIATMAYDRIHDPYLYEGRGFFGVLRVRETEASWHALPLTSDSDLRLYEWKKYRELIHGGINHGRQIVEYKDTVVVVPHLAVSTVGLLATPSGAAPWLSIGEWAPSKFSDVAVLGLMADQYDNATLTRLKRREAITYFHERNGIAEVYRKFSWHDARLPASMVGLMCGPCGALGMLVNTQSEAPYAVIGLGTGLLASYAKPLQRVDFYEIDPLVRDLSLPPGGKEPIFWFLRDAIDRGAALDVKMGDGRLRLKEAPANYYHIITLDAFSSDAIPVHLLTAEAIELYMSKLVEGGVLVFNTTNRYVRIEGVLAAIANEKGYDCLHCPDFTYKHDHPDRFAADWVVLQRPIAKNKYRNGGPPIAERLEKSRKRTSWNGQPIYDEDGTQRMDKRWQTVQPLPGPIWTDSYSNLLKAMSWGG